MTTKQIARRLTLSPKTIETHREKIKKKLSLKNSAELSCRAGAVGPRTPRRELTAQFCQVVFPASAGRCSPQHWRRVRYSVACRFDTRSR